MESLTAGGKDYLLFTLTFPATAPGNLAVNPTACSGTGATENMEGCTSVLTYNFLATQRAGSAQVEDLGGKFAIEVQPGDVLTIETPGGGAFGRASNEGHA